MGVGIIGCGVIGPVHLESYLLVPGVRVRAVCDLRPDRMERLADRHPKLSLARHSRYADLLADPEIHAVSVCTDHASHEEIVLAALAAGKHVLCEKPLGISAASLDRMVAAAEAAAPLVCAGVFQHRFDPIYRRLRAIIAEGRLGRMLTASARHYCDRPASYYHADGWRGTRQGEGGSLLINQSIHFLDILQWVMGGADCLQAATANLAHSGVIETEDTAALLLRFPDGALGAFTATSASHHAWQSALQFIGTEGSVLIENGHLRKCAHRDGAVAAALESRLSNITETEGVAAAKVYYGTSHPAQIRDFIEAIRQRRAPEIPFREARKAVDLVLAAYAAAR